MANWSLKPGRGPSLAGGVSGIIAIVFGVFWTILAFSITGDAPGAFHIFFPAFGLLFVLVGIASMIYNFYNAGAKNRFSLLDVTDDEPDPLDPHQDHRRDQEDEHRTDTRRPGNSGSKFCPQCGKAVEPTHDYCPYCGHDL